MAADLMPPSRDLPAHSRTMLYFLSHLQAAMTGGLLQLTGMIALFTSGLLVTEGIGVYLQKRWAEVLMVVATAMLIPFELRHVWFHPGVVSILIVAVNCFIVWFLYRELRRERREEAAPPATEEPVVVETR